MMADRRRGAGANPTAQASDSRLYAADHHHVLRKRRG
jgi:hypothetical protein